MSNYKFGTPWVSVTSSNVCVMDFDATAQFMRHRTDGKKMACQKDIDYLADQGMPIDLANLAARYAPRLASTLEQAVPRMMRHQTVGSLDTSKLVRLARPVSQQAFEHDAATAFRRRGTVTQQQKLKIAIVGDYCYDLRMHNNQYVSNMTRLVHVISEAAAIAGMQCAAYGVRGHLRMQFLKHGTGSKPYAFSALLKPYDRRMVPQTFYAVSNEDVFVQLYYQATGKGAGSANGTGGIDYAREIDGANFIVGIGTFFDKHRPDVQLSAGLSLDAMVDTVHGALKVHMAQHSTGRQHEHI